MKNFFLPRSEKIWVLIFSITFIVYFFTSAGATPYNYFTRLANAFLHGRYYLLDNPPWLDELVPIGKQMFAVVYPPAAAILLIPFVAIFGEGFPQQIFAHLVGASIVTVWGIISFKLTGDKTKTVWVTLLVGFGNIIWFMSSVGSVWYLSQTVAVLFLSLAILEIETKNRVVVTALFFGIAFLSRIEVLLTLPFFFFLTKRENRLDFLASLFPFVFLYGIYNIIRFGKPWETGYDLIPGILSEPWYGKGILNLSYIPRHLSVIFAALPIFSSTPPFVSPSWQGLAIWITSPAFVYALIAPFKNLKTKLSWLSMTAVAILVFMHGTTGFSQFGYRFAVDFYPFVFLLLIISIKDRKITWHHWLLLVLSIAVNTWGVILINKLGVVSYYY